MPRRSHPSCPPPATSHVAALDAFLERASEWLNPILVKEARQALKSRQFIVTFGLVLMYSWGVSIVGLAMIGPEATYGAKGPVMFGWYYAGLAFCLLIVVPFGAFRSLAVEQEERTYELLSITALKPRQIVSGKLGSAVVQMLVYLSAISPCLAFTYMLRGIDVLTILYILAWTALASLGLSQAGLVMGTLTENKALQVVLAVVVILGLVVAAIIGLYAALGIVFLGRIDFANIDFLVGNAAGLTAWAGYMALGFFASVARITFASDNRSTRLRSRDAPPALPFRRLAGMALVYDGCQFRRYFRRLGTVRGSCRRPLVPHGRADDQRVAAIVAAGETQSPAELPGPHVPDLVQSGPGNRIYLRDRRSGGGFSSDPRRPDDGSRDVGRIVGPRGRFLRAMPFLLRRPRNLVLGDLSGDRTGNHPPAPPVFVDRSPGRTADPPRADLAGLPGPCLVGMMISPNGRLDWSLLYTPCFPWTLARYGENWPPRSLPSDTTALMLVVPLTAGVVFLANLPGVARELRHVRIAPPPRVIEEDAQLAPPRRLYRCRKVPGIRIWSEICTEFSCGADFSPPRWTKVRPARVSY